MVKERAVLPIMMVDLTDTWTPWTGDQPCRKAATYTGLHGKETRKDSS
jgi:hypothetical protein